MLVNKEIIDGFSKIQETLKLIEEWERLLQTLDDVKEKCQQPLSRAEGTDSFLNANNKIAPT